MNKRALNKCVNFFGHFVVVAHFKRSTKIKQKQENIFIQFSSFKMIKCYLLFSDDG